MEKHITLPLAHMEGLTGPINKNVQHYVRAYSIPFAACALPD